MKLQVLVSTMNQMDHCLLEKMNMNSDAIVINQCQENKFEKFNYKGHTIQFLSFDERGVGLSRNNALMRAKADICIFADDDVMYEDNYNEKIIQAFETNKDADIILFHIPSKNPERPTIRITKQKRVRWFNCQRYGAVNIAFRTSSILHANTYFSLLFGGGAKYSSGEDSLFLSDCIRKKLKVYTNPSIIGFVTQDDSTWFHGYTDKYFIDKGIFYYHLSKRWAWLLCLQFVLRHRNLFKENKTMVEAFRLELQGISKVKN